MKKFAIITLKGLGWLLLALLLLALAWLASNNRWVDARSDAVPPALQLPSPTLPAERNAYFTLIGLNAPAGDDPNQLGQRRWSACYREAESGPLLRWPEPKGSDAASSWTCRFDKEDCVARWREQSAALQTLLQTHALIGSRCEALAEAGLALEEVLPTPSAELKKPEDQYAAKALPPMQNWVQCGRWLRVQAVLAQQRGDTAALRQALQRSQNYTQGLLTNARTLIANLLAWRIATDHWQVAVALAARQPMLAADMIRMIEPLPPQALDASRWMAHEAHFSRQVTRELGLSCRPGGLSPDDVPGQGQMDRAFMCSHFGFMPRATQQLLDEYWLQGIEKARGGPLALLDWSPQPRGLRIFGMAWHNTLGHFLVDVAAPMYPSYGLQHADLVLNHELALLALNASAHQPADRAAWLAALPLDERLRGRIRLEDGQIVARPWHAGDEPGMTVHYPIPRLQDT